jgi:hypothetical protein
MVVRVGDVDGAAPIDCELPRVVDLAVARAEVGERGHEPAGRRPHGDACSIRTLDDVEIPVRRHGDPLREQHPVDSYLRPGRRADRPDEGARGRELHDPAVLVVGDVDVALPVGRDAAQASELTVAFAVAPPLAEEVAAAPGPA